ncbi:MAG TPA: efflux RND transporter periplasmic adaptor subunit [Verrucomicrobiae bacterium]|jgi:membrane fusion protein (multidrug efflux system)|nr:efflux RND transporter periplasmic adaptor subunit [Verrucomicrobiae bacterium]
MKRKIFIAIGIVVVIFIALAGIKFLQIHSMIAFGKTFVPPPDAVSSAVAHEEKWQDTLTAVGSIDPQNGVTLASEVAGTVAEIAVADGTVVAKGDLLLRLDTSSEEAQLRSAETQTELSRLNAERTRSLRAGNTVSQSELDTAEATLKQDAANADVIRAAIEKKTIRAPFAGRLGIWQVNVGATLDARRALVSLQSLTPVYADFSMPQQNLSQLKTGQAVQVTCDAYPGQKFDGVLTAINPDLDAATRSVPLRATFENTNQLLRPGMFVRVAVVLPQAGAVLAIPATAVLSAPFGDSVYVIEQSTNSAGGLVVRQQFVRTGQSHGDSVSVLTGLKAGDKVVSAGLFKLRNGAPVTINNDIVPPTVKNPPDS